MTKEELASKLNGREYGKELTPEEEAEAKENRLVVIFCCSDDCVELRGAVNDEMYSDPYFNDDGLIVNECDDDDCPYFERLIKQAKGKVSSTWFKGEYTCIFETAIPHASFDIMDAGEKYCRGIVIELP